MVEVKDLARHEGTEVTVAGWVDRLRVHGKVGFVVIRDGTGYVQGVLVKEELPEEVWATGAALTQEATVEVTGVVRADARSPGGFEMGLSNLRLLGASPEYPIQPKEHGVEFLLDHRHLWLRSSQQRAGLKVRAEVEQAIHDFLYQREFVRIDTPILTGSIGEHAGTLFETDYFGESAYLAQTGQLYAEAACPAFRNQEEMVSFLVERTLERARAELEYLERDLSKLESVKPPFPRVSYGDAVTRLQEKGSEIKWGEDIGGADETLLSEDYDLPVFVFNYPKGVKAFYMKENPDDPTTVLCDDLIAPEGYGEIIGGSQREDDLDRLLAGIHEQNLPEAAYGWYLDLRRFGTFPHSGFGLGLERTVAWITGRPHIRELIPFPRLINRLYP